MLAEIEGQVGPLVLSDGTNAPVRQDRAGSVVVTQSHGRYYEPAYRKNLHIAQAITTAMVIYSTAASTGGPILYNPTGNAYNAVILAASFAVTTASTVIGAVGLTGGASTTQVVGTAIDGSTNSFLGGPATTMTLARLGTPTSAGGFLLPLFPIGTTAVASNTNGGGWVPIEGGLIVPPGFWVSLASSATMTTMVATGGLLWEEVPV